MSLDDMIVGAQANEDPELFLRTYGTPLVIDEFHMLLIYYLILK